MRRNLITPPITCVSRPPLCDPNCLLTALYLVAMQTARDKATDASATIFCLTFTIVP